MQALVKEDYCSEESRIKIDNRNHLKQLSEFRVNFTTMSMEPKTQKPILIETKSEQKKPIINLVNTLDIKIDETDIKKRGRPKGIEVSKSTRKKMSKSALKRWRNPTK